MTTGASRVVRPLAVRRGRFSDLESVRVVATSLDADHDDLLRREGAKWRIVAVARGRTACRLPTVPQPWLPSSPSWARGGLGTLTRIRRLRAGLRCASGQVAVGFLALATVVANSTAPITASDVVVAIADDRPAGGPSAARACARPRPPHGGRCDLRRGPEETDPIAASTNRMVSRGVTSPRSPGRQADTRIRISLMSLGRPVGRRP